jgi:hypothetical protein
MTTSETFEDGTYALYYDDGSYELYTADGYLIDSYYPPASAVASSNQPPDHSIGIIESIGDVLSSIFGGGRQGYYSPSRGRQPVQSYPRGNYPVTGSGYQPPCSGIQIGASALGGGGGVCISKGWIIAGGALALFFALGQRRGRGR